MTLQEASIQFHLSLDDLKLCEINQLFNGCGNKSGEMDYTETELKRVIPFLFLLEAGMPIEKLKEFITHPEGRADTDEERIRMLRKCRSQLMDQLHGKQQLLDQIDYLIREMKK